ncbi:unnamed protein product [Bursaphelenchus okinawaensis]|uniref:Nucleolus and neural progenitor protein-like N-terminal domain-containing protein n=1 Tax=Bursaphelenchus okinawaensis TaxID=465554 RepID=A0A811K7R4_9BILA|nr:unnamed protein product [Bursaphelenchus okinawaensis]CAG9095021.1 unnamed protein product [Bursaphelenchus okinawaensis]
MNREAFLQFVDKSVGTIAKKSFRSERERDSDKKQRWELNRMKLFATVTSLRQNKASEFPANEKIVKIYEAINYKYGQAYRHHNFFRSAKQLFSLIRRLCNGNFLKQLERLHKGLSDCKCEYIPHNDFLIHTGALLCRRIYLLDRIRLLAARNVDFDLGYIELGHFLKFNMLLASMAAEVADQARTHLKLLIKSYNEVADCFCLASDNFPTTVYGFKLESVEVDNNGELIEGQKNLDNVKMLCRVIDKTVDPTSSEMSMDDLKNKIEREMLLLTADEEDDKVETEPSFYKTIDISRKRKRKNKK